MANPAPANPNGAVPVIRRTTLPRTDEGAGVLLRILPAWIVSFVAHVVIMGLFFLVTVPGSGASTETEQVVIESKVEDKPEEANLTNEDIGLNPDLPTNYDVDRIAEISVPGPVDVNAAIGIHNAPEAAAMTVPPPPGLGGGTGAGLDAAFKGTGSLVGLAGGMGGLMQAGGFGGRSGATRQRMVEAGGGNGLSEAAVARALKWIAMHQAPDGRWALNSFHQHARDPKSLRPLGTPCNCGGRGTSNDIAGTAFGLLPLLAAGETHKQPTTRGDVHYTKTVEQGLKYLMLKQQASGEFGGGMYAHGLASIAMCEAYGLTSDPLLKSSAQRALDFIVKAQHSGGGWRYSPGQAGDTSVVGWQVMALKSGQMAGLSVPTATIKGAERYLDSVMSSNGGYGYTGPQPTPTMSAVGLLCRQYLGWSPRNVQLINGVANHVKPTPPGKLNSMYYYYYATQVMHHMGGESWAEWNPQMRDWLVKTQDKGTTPGKPHQMGSWDPGSDAHGGVGGRLMMTSLCCLTLEVYYRHLPLYRRDMGGMKAEK